MFKKFNPLWLYHQAFWSEKTRMATILGTLAYFVMPIDFVPDFILGPGQVDDGLLLAVFGVELVMLLINQRKNLPNLKNFNSGNLKQSQNQNDTKKEVPRSTQEDVIDAEYEARPAGSVQHN